MLRALTLLLALIVVPALAQDNKYEDIAVFERMFQDAISTTSDMVDAGVIRPEEGTMVQSALDDLEDAIHAWYDELGDDDLRRAAREQFFRYYQLLARLEAR